MSTRLTNVRPTFRAGEAIRLLVGDTAPAATTLAPVHPPPEVVLRVSGLERRFGEHRAVQGISFEAHRGEVLGLLGPNGAGKSTTLRLLAGLLSPHAGSVTLGEEVLDPRRPAARAQIGFVPQDIALYAELSAEENLRFFGKLYGLRGARLSARVESALELAGLVDRRAHRVRTFSGGMQRRLNLACAVLHSPRVLLLDEPTVGVDPHSRNHLITALMQLKSQGLTMIYSTHHMDDAERLCDRVAIVDAGRILALASPAELIVRQAARDLEGVFLELTGRCLRDD